MTRTWLITGIPRGLGRASPRPCWRGDRVVATARGRNSWSIWWTSTVPVRAVALDVTNPEQARAADPYRGRAFGGLDVVVNNAGYATSRRSRK